MPLSQMAWGIYAMRERNKEVRMSMKRADLLSEWIIHYSNAVRFGSHRPDLIANILTFGTEEGEQR